MILMNPDMVLAIVHLKLSRNGAMNAKSSTMVVQMAGKPLASAKKITNTIDPKTKIASARTIKSPSIAAGLESESKIVRTIVLLS